MYTFFCKNLSLFKRKKGSGDHCHDAGCYHSKEKKMLLPLRRVVYYKIIQRYFSGACAEEKGSISILKK